LHRRVRSRTRETREDSDIIPEGMGGKSSHREPRDETPRIGRQSRTRRSAPPPGDRRDEGKAARPAGNGIPCERGTSATVGDEPGTSRGRPDHRHEGCEREGDRLDGRRGRAGPAPTRIGSTPRGDGQSRGRYREPPEGNRKGITSPDQRGQRSLGLPEVASTVEGYRR